MEVRLNGAKLCTAGITTNASLNATVEVFEDQGAYQMSLRVGGLQNEQYVVWADCKLSVGDEIHVRMVETDFVDVPQLQNPNSNSIS